MWGRGAERSECGEGEQRGVSVGNGGGKERGRNVEEGRSEAESVYLTRSGVSTSRIFNTRNRVLYLTSEDLGLSSAVAQLGTTDAVHV